jgi:hypothetical protein
MPVSFRSTNADATPPVVNPPVCRSCASVGRSAGSVKPTLSRTPVSNGSSPVRIAVCEGSVCGECAYARLKTIPSRASASIAGVFTLR